MWLCGQPVILGHEFSGIVESGEFAGQRVAIDPAIPCNKCEFCRIGKQHLCPKVRIAGGAIGALTEYVVWPERNLNPLPKELSDAEGALLEPLGVALHARDLCDFKPGMTVGINGCGIIGLLLVQLARLSGASRIFATDQLPHRLELARKFGATDTYPANPSTTEAILATTQQRGLDVVFEAAGTPAAIESATRIAKPGGIVVLVGITKENRISFSEDARFKELTIILAQRMNFTYPRAIALVKAGLVDLRSLITHQFPFREAEKAFASAERREGLKVIINVNE
jgi:L-iditol 2-dehydrogenase